MPLRKLEFTVPQGEAGQLADILAEHSILHVWRWTAADGTEIVRILLEAEQVEALSAALLSQFGPSPDFRMLVLSVEAAVPRLEEPERREGGVEGPESGTEGRMRISREELYEDLVQASRLTPVYLVTVVLSTVVAAVGLIRGDVAIIIGAMVIAPLLGPNVALSLACTLGDLGLASRSLKVNLAGVLVAAALSLAIGAAFTIDPAATEIFSRTQANVGDIALALAAGAAGSLAFTSGVPAVLVGVMVAVALLPPLVVAGLLAGAGFGERAAGAMMLLVTNLACVNLAAVATFLVQRIRPAFLWEEARARRATGIAVATWIIMILALLAVMLLRPAA